MCSTSGHGNNSLDSDEVKVLKNYFIEMIVRIVVNATVREVYEESDPVSEVQRQEPEP